MKFKKQTTNKFNNNDIKDILEFSKEENKKYLYQMMSIKKISAFDVSYIMNKLKLTDEKIKLIELVLDEYENNKIINESESYSDFLYRVIRNIEKLEKHNSTLLNEIAKCKNSLNNFVYFIEDLILKSSCVVENAISFNQEQNFVFSKIYIDK